MNSYSLVISNFPSLCFYCMATSSLILILLFTITISIHFTLTLSEGIIYQPVNPDNPVNLSTIDYPTTNLSTIWTLNNSLANNISYTDGSTILPLLLYYNSRASFTFGFFCNAPCSTFLLSIYVFYNNLPPNSDLESPRVVWSANPNRPVHLNATLLFSSDGDLILRDADGSFVWSTNTSGRGGERLSMLDSGNLVVLDRKSKQLWASFDQPTDSLLLGQSLRQGQRLTANSSATNATRGQFYVEILEDGLHAFVDSNPPQLYYSNTNRVAWSLKSQNRSTSVAFVNGSLYILSSALPVGSCQYLRLEDDGHFRLYEWNFGWQILGDVFDVFLDHCDYPTVCGQYGICSNEQCTCPQSADGNSTYFKPINSTKISFGCSVVTPISCDLMDRHQLLELHSVSYFNYIDLSSPIAVYDIDEERCKHACLRNCSCKAAFFQYGGDLSSSSCYLPSQIFSLMDNKPAITHYNSSAFLKVQIALSTIPSSGTSQRTRSTHSWRKKLVIGLVSGSLFAGLFVAFIIIYARRGAKQLEELDQFDEIRGMMFKFSYEELKSATKNFEQMVGKGGFGAVFKGTLSNGTDIAVKRLDGVGQAKKQFLTEVQTIGSIHHINLVSLVGFCVHKSYTLLVMEYMPNGSLDAWIFGKTKDTSLDWKTRFNIILNIAKGLAYLHEGCRHRIAHLDIKPQNILLDENFNAKVADFGLSKLIDRDQREIMTRMRGTPGYLAPEWLTSIITEKVDVYSFGIVVLEIICGRRNLERLLDEELNLIGLVQEKLRDDLLVELFDKNSNDIQVHMEEAIEMMRLAIWCLHIDCNRRPSMSMVVKVLEGSTNLNINIDYDFLGTNVLSTKSVRMSSPSVFENDEPSSLLLGR